MSGHRDNDESVLIDYVLGQCDAQTAEQVARRLEQDEGFRQLHTDVVSTFAAVRLAPQAEPPEDLVSKTLARLRTATQMERLVTREELSRPAGRATFSLRELAALAASLLILALVFVPSVRQARFRAGINRCASNAGQIGAAFQNYTNVHGGALPAPDGSARRWLACDGQPAASSSAGLFKLVRHGYASPTVFQCPTRKVITFVVRSDMQDFPSAEHITYSYQHVLGPRALSARDPVLAAVAEHMVILADRTPLFDGSRFRPDRLRAKASDNHGGRGQTVLYLDMHVGWAQTAEVGVNGDNIFLARDTYEYDGDEAPAGPTDTFLLPAHTGR